MRFQVKEAETVCSIFKDNYALCNEVNDKVIQHFINCIETHGRHVEYLKFFQTIVKAENQFIRKSQDTIMQEVSFLSPPRLRFLWLQLKFAFNSWSMRVKIY